MTAESCSEGPMWRKRLGNSAATGNANPLEKRIWRANLPLELFTGGLGKLNTCGCEQLVCLACFTHAKGPETPEKINISGLEIFHSPKKKTSKVIFNAIDQVCAKCKHFIYVHTLIAVNASWVKRRVNMF